MQSGQDTIPFLRNKGPTFDALFLNQNIAINNNCIRENTSIKTISFAQFKKTFESNFDIRAFNTWLEINSWNVASIHASIRY